MTRADFLSNPLGQFRSGTGSIPPEWIREAWVTNEDFRGELWYSISRELDKNGELNGIRGLALVLANSLTREDVVELFVGLGGAGSHYRLLEWRGQFEEVFARYADALPPITEDAMQRLYAIYIAQAIYYAKTATVEKFLEDLQRRGGDVNRLCRVTALEPALGRIVHELAELGSDQGFTMLQLARGLGREEIVQILLRAGATS
jgi:hypothetical protein